MKKMRWVRILALCLSMACLVAAVGAANLSWDLNKDDKTNVWDLQLAVNEGKTAAEKQAALEEALGGKDELHPNASGEYEIYTALGLYNMANMTNAGKESGKTFKLMNDIDMEGAAWQSTESFNGVFEGNGKTVSNVNVYGEIVLSTNNYGHGFFGKIGQNGAVRNLKLENVTNILTEDSKANFIGLLTGSLTGEITNCTTVGTVIDPRTTLPATTYIGTLTGRIENVSTYTVPGISVTDESIVMTAESAAVTAISGKSQKVLCKMGMDFGELSYPEGTDSKLQYKRQLGIAGWAPNYDNFKAYNWQDISGACTVTGGSGKTYDLEDPILVQRRQDTVDKMYEICTVAWTPSQNMTIYYYKVKATTSDVLNYSEKTWKAGTTYYGMPYNHGSGSLERFEAWMDTGSNGILTTKTSLPTTAYYYTHGTEKVTVDGKETSVTMGVRKLLSEYTGSGALTYTDPNTGMTYDLTGGFTVSDQALTVGETVNSADHAGFSRYIGNDCSQAIQWAWREVVSSDVANGGTVISGVTQMTPTKTYQTRHGVRPVGGLVPSAYSVKAWDELYTAKGKTGFMEAYAQASRGDALIVDQTAGGHSRMIAYDPICIRDYRGNISATNSYIITHEQGRSKNSTTTCYPDCVYTFEALTSDSTHGTGTDGSECKHYMPMTIPAFHDVNNDAVTSEVTYSNGVVKSNFYIVSTTVDGNEEFTAIGQHNNVTPDNTWVGTGYREAQLTVDAAAVHGDVTGKTITVRLSNGDVYTVNAGTGAVTKK